MEIKSIIIIILSLSNLLLLTRNLFKNFPFYSREKITSLILSIFLTNLFLFFLGLFFIFHYSEESLIQFYSLFFLVNSFLLIEIMTKKNYPRFFLFFIYLVIISCFFMGFFGELILLSVSFLLLLLFSLFILQDDKRRQIGLLGVIFSSFCLFLILIFFRNTTHFIFFIFSYLAFSIYLFFVLSRIILIYQYKDKNRKKSFFGVFSRNFIFIATFVNIIFIATLGLHELGHFLPSIFLGCSNQKIVFEGIALRTFMVCGEDATKILVAGSFFLPSLFALFFIYSGGKFLRGAGELIIGLNLFALNKDLAEIGILAFTRIIILIVGLILIIFSIFHLIKNRHDLEEIFLE